MVSEYKFCCHNKCWVVFTPDWHLDTALSAYAREQAQYAKNTFDSYTRQVRKWLSFLANRKITGSPGAIWNLEPRRLRSLVYTYLTEETECKVPRTRFNENARMVVEQSFTSGSPRQFMAALISFYQIMRDLGFYRYRSPLELTVSERKDRKESPPKKRMPQVSGCKEPYRKEYRLTNNYYIFKFKEWVPRSINCKNFPVLVKTAGIEVGWSAREQVIFDILTESGC